MKVKFVPQNVEFSIEPGQCVMHVAQDHDLYIKSVCKGVPSCAECRVRVIDGEHNVLPPGSEELSLIGTGHFIDRRRLSCQLKCFGDITIDMTEQLAKQSGAISGQKKKKLAIKDDRIEDAVAIRANLPEDETAGESAPRPARGPGGGPGGQPRRQPQQQQERKARPSVGGGGSRPAGAGEQVSRPGPENNEAPKNPRPQQNQQPRAAAPAGAEGEKSDKPRRKRRRGGGGGRGGGERGPSGGEGGGGGPKPRAPGPTGASN